VIQGLILAYIAHFVKKPLTHVIIFRARWWILIYYKKCERTDCRGCRHTLGGLAGSRRTRLHMQQRTAGGRNGCHFKKYDATSEMRLRRLMHIYLKKNHAKLHSDSMWNDAASGFLKRSPQHEEQKRRSWVVIWDYFWNPDPEVALVMVLVRAFDLWSTDRASSTLGRALLG